MPLVVERLKKVRERLAQGWTQGCYARDKDGKRTQPTWPDAVRWCVLGACYSSTEPGLFSGSCDTDARDALYQALDDIGQKTGLATWNDLAGRTQEEVLALVDRAIANAGG